MSDFSVDDFIQELKSTDNSPDVVMNPPKEYSTELYKKWFRSKTQSGFVSIRPWFQGMKFKVDIGKTSLDGSLISSTNSYLDVFDFCSYLQSIANSTARTNYPANERLGVPSPEGFVSYGGAEVSGKYISRIFKAHYWQNDQTFDDNSFVWKCGHFAARKSDTGAFIPDLKSPLSVDFIKLTRQDVCVIAYTLDKALSAYLANNSDWYDV